MKTNYNLTKVIKSLKNISKNECISEYIGSTTVISKLSVTIGHLEIFKINKIVDNFKKSLKSKDFPNGEGKGIEKISKKLCINIFKGRYIKSLFSGKDNFISTQKENDEPLKVICRLSIPEYRKDVIKLIIKKKLHLRDFDLLLKLEAAICGMLLNYIETNVVRGSLLRSPNGSTFEPSYPINKIYNRFKLNKDRNILGKRVYSIINDSIIEVDCLGDQGISKSVPTYVKCSDRSFARYIRLLKSIGNVKFYNNKKHILIRPGDINV